MSISCQQQITINVKSGTRWYWTLDEPGASDNRVDKFAGAIIAPKTGGGFNPPVVDPAGLYGKAVRFNDPAPSTCSILSVPQADPKITYKHNAGATWWSWLKWNNNMGPGGPFVAWSITMLQADGITNNGQIEFLSTGTTVSAFASDIANTALVNVPISNVNGVFHLIACKYDPINNAGKCSIKIDNGAWTHSAISGIDILASPFCFVDLFTTGGGNNLDTTMDECGFFFEVLTDPQLTTLYNGGLGITWPAVQTL